MRSPIGDLSGKTFDVTVIGAGINGCAAAQELAGAGYEVLLVDKGDYGAGSSSRSTRLLHCGLRYLAPGGSPYDWLARPRQLLTALSMTRKAMQARAEFVRNSPQRVRALTFGFPVWEGMPYRPWHLDLGLRIVDSLGPDEVPLDRRFIAAKELDAEPLYRDVRDRDKLVGVNTFTEYQFNWPERIAMDMVRDGLRMGATCRNYTSVCGLEATDDGWQIQLSDMAGEPGDVIVNSALIVNTAGIWIDEVNRLANPGASRKILGTKGAHIVLRLPSHYQDRGLITFNRELTEPVYLVPWRNGLHYMGVTETVYEGDLNDVRVDEHDVDWLLSELNSLLPALSVTRRDILHGWAGVRPLTYDPASPKGARSREIHDLADAGMPGAYALTAGPVMTHRSAGRELLGAIRGRLTPHGSVQSPCYAPELAPGREDSPSLLNDDDSIRIADLRDAVEREHVTCLTDLLARRVGVVWTERQGREAARAAAEAVADLTGWDHDRVEHEVRSYEAYLARTHQVPGAHGGARN